MAILNSKPNLNSQSYQEPQAHVFNPTLEKVRVQVNSRGFSFEPQELVEVPVSLADVVGEKVSHRGLFIVWPGQDIKDLGHVKLEALKNFKDFNADRIRMEMLYIDERRKAGVTIDMSTQSNYQKWKKWDEELEKILNMSSANETPKSFLEVVQLSDKKDVKETVTKATKEDKVVADVVSEEVKEASKSALVADDIFLSDEEEVDAAPKKRGRPALS